MMPETPWPDPHTLARQWPIVEPPHGFFAWRNSHTREAVAYHEAGHAVLLHLIGATTVHAAAADEGTGTTRCSRADPLPAGPSNDAEDQAACIFAAAACHAGMEAELLHGRFTPAAGEGWHAIHQPDLDLAERILAASFSTAPHGYTKAVARAILCLNWHAIELIAVHILVRGEWRSGDTPGLTIRMGEESGTVLQACLALEMPVQERSVELLALKITA